MNKSILSYQWRALAILCAFHIIIIASSNYLVQFPFPVNILGKVIYTTPGSFTFPFIFLATDLTIRVFGAPLARKIIAVTMLPALIVSYFVSFYFNEGTFNATKLYFDMGIFRIALASFSAYTFGQLSDILVFDKIRRERAWWVAPSAASIVGAALDTLIFFFISFYRSEDAFMAENWFKLGVVDYMTKLVVYALFFLPLYGMLLNWIQRKISRQNQ